MNRPDITRGNPLKYGLIACGDMARTHVMNVATRPDLFQVTAICDINNAQMDELQNLLPPEHPTPKRYSNYKQLLDTGDVEAVIVSTPNTLHLEPVIDSFDAGKHVFCEKPFAVTLDECDQMIAARDRTGLVLQIGLVLRYAKTLQAMANTIAQGQIGDPLMAWCHEFRAPFPIGQGREWRYEKEKSGGAILEKNCHHFDMFEWMLGAKTTCVQGFGGRHVVENGKHLDAMPDVGEFEKLVKQNDILDHAVINLEFDTGAKASLLLCFFAPNNGLPFGVLGSKGRMSTNVNRQLKGFFLHENMRALDYEDDIPSGEFISVSENQMGEDFIVHPGGLGQHLAFYESVRMGTPVFCTAEIGKQSTAVALAVQESIYSGGTLVDVSS
jgi:predicted dehydrogenase